MGGRVIGPVLRLVVCAPSGIVYLGNAAELAAERRLLVAEAMAIEGQYGKNAYSDYILKHGRRPDRDQAAVKVCSGSSAPCIVNRGVTA